MRFVALLAFLLCAPPAWADPPPSATFLAREIGISEDEITRASNSVNQCLERALDRPAMQACERIVAEPCYGGAYADTTYGQWRCARLLRAAWEPALLSARETARKGGGLTDLDHAEGVWEQWRSEWCGFIESRYEGGTQAKVVLSYCFAQADIAHTIELRLSEVTY